MVVFPASGTALILFRESSVALTLCYVSFEWCSVVVFPPNGNVLFFADGVAIVLFYAYGVALLLFPASGVASVSNDVPRLCFL